MDNKTIKFETKIKDTFIKYGRVPFLVVLGVVLVLLIMYYTYTRIYTIYKITNDVNENIVHTLEILEGVELEDTNRYSELYTLRNQISEDLQILSFDEDYNLNFTSQPSLEGSDYLRIYNRIIISNLEPDETKLSILSPLDLDINYLVMSMKDSDEFIMYFIPNMRDLEYLKGLNLDVAITDSFDNIYYSSNKLFTNNLNKLDLENLEGYEHTMREGEHGLYIHFFLKSDAYIFILLVISSVLLFTYVLMQKINKKSAKRIGEDFSHSVKLLHEAVSEMGSGNLDTRVHIQSDDEFSDLGLAFNQMNERLSLVIERNEKLIALNKDSEMKQLEAQFNPHFLYNTLETIKYLVDEDPELASELIVRTTVLLRYSIDETSSNVKFSDDLEYINQYLEIHKLRLQDRFVYGIDIEEEVLDLVLPKLLIQPLIENSLKHGFMNKMSLRMDITAYMFEDSLYIYVIDDGGGMDQETVDELNDYNYQNQNTQGYGIKSVIQRIKLMYGDESVFMIYSDDESTIIEIIIKEVYQDV